MITVPISVAELIDKITILEIKLAVMTDPAKIKNCRTEIDFLTRIKDSHKIHFPKHQEELKKVNLRLWEIVDELRKADARQCFDQKFIEWAKEEYRVNDLRAKIKREINDLAHSEIIEEKEYASY